MPCVTTTYKAHGLQNSVSFDKNQETSSPALLNFISNPIASPLLKDISYLSSLELNWFWRLVFIAYMLFPFFTFRPLP